MSLIVARKFEGQLYIVSDTKLTHPYHELKGSKTKPSDGVVKTIILRPDVCISFAGDVPDAELAVKQINVTDSIEKIIEILTGYHEETSYKTEFILCYVQARPVIYKFKAGECKEVVTAWIGDQQAFNLFQKSVLGEIKKEKLKKPKKQNSNLPATNQPVVTMEMNFTIEASISEFYSKMSNAMDVVIENGNIQNVGGFKVAVVYKDEKGFYYNFYSRMYRGEFTLIGIGSQFITHGEADEGAYSINFFGGSPDFLTVGLHVKQAKLGIVYHRQDNGLLWPHYHWMDEVDFRDLVEERYNLHAPLGTQDRFAKFREEGLAAFKLHEWPKAMKFFDKALSSARDKQRAELLYLKGLTFFNLRDHQNGMKAFQEAVAIDPQIRVRINNSFAQEKR